MGRGAATMYPGSLADADCIVIEGSNMAECHPVAFRWVMQAKLRGAKVIHVDPRFTRTSALADIYAPIRAGSDVAFLGGLIRYMIENNRYFREYVVNYTNAATLIDPNYRDTEDLGGIFSGLRPYSGPPIDGNIAEYDTETWQYEGHPLSEGGRGADQDDRGGRQQGGGGGQGSGEPLLQTVWPGVPGGFDPAIRAMVQPPPPRDETLQHPRCVFQIVRRHFSRYTPEMVERVTGCPQETFLQIAEAIAANSGPDRTTSFCYAVGWTQHTNGPQMISCAALLQLLMGNIGRPGGGIVALRGHATIQGSTDIPTLYHSIHGYMDAPSTLEPHDTLADYMRSEGEAGGYWANIPKFMVSYLKSMYGDAARPENHFGYDWHPKIDGDYSHLPMTVRMAEGQVRGMLCIGQNPAVGAQNARLQRKALAKLDWLVVKDNFEHETAAFWYNSPEVHRGELRPQDIRTEVFLFPSAQIAEMEGSFTNTQRLVQWKEKAVDPPEDCRDDSWFTHQLALRLKRLYANSTLPRDQGFLNLLWDFDHDPGRYPRTRIEGQPDAEKILKEINGYYTATKAHLSGFDQLRDDGSTTCASWIYCGIFPREGENKARNRVSYPANPAGAQLGWGFSWPDNRRILYNRASARPDGRPWSERKRWVWWDEVQRRWTGFDIPDFPTEKPPNAPAIPGAIGLDAHSGIDPFIMKPDGKGWLYAPVGFEDGPLPVHYEPAESPVVNPLYPRQSWSPVLKYWNRADNMLVPQGDPRYPYVITTYRLTEHHLTGVMTRWLPWLAELQPELFLEMSPELAAEKGIQNLDWARISTPRGAIRAKALVTRRMRPLRVDGRVIHQVGMPYHWGFQGVVTGDVVNDLAALVADPNVSIHEGKAFVCNVERA
jgi:formate dehydrogenase major subunit